ncbi:response regulator [Runella sp. MFBS21]|uniref:response regulator n=1 Tax=Runella sp. MFBS21 TaxID=3034018 RepID=UPI0023F62CBC|nr:response regulator [Runella sp. MFBS21]MDF7817303.1 response regulator [Runella sp. MFBS21]
MKILFFVVCCFCSFIALSQEVSLTPSTKSINITEKIAVFEDKNASLSFPQVQQQVFTPFSQRSILIPFSDEAFWVKFKVKNTHPAQDDWILDWSNFFAEYVSFFVQQDDGDFQEIKKGALVARGNAKRDNPYINFKIGYQEEKVFYVKILSQRGLYGRFTILTPEAMAEEQIDDAKSESFINGLIVLRLVYVLLLAAFVVKELAFRRYSILLIMRSFAYWGFVGVLGGFFTNNVTTALTINFLSYHVLPIGQVLAATAILPIARFPSFVSHAFKIVVALTLVLALGIIFDYRWYWLKASTYLIICTQLSIFALYIVAVWRKYPLNWYYSVPFLLGIGSYIFIQMRLVSWVNFGWIFAFANFCFISEIFVFGVFLSRIIQNYEKACLVSQKELRFNQEQASRLKELDELKTNFFTNISHEFRTPLTLLIGPLADFQKKYPGERLVEIMQRNIMRLQSLINQLLDLSKLEAGKLQPEIQKGDLALHLRHLFGSFESLAQSRNIIFHYEQTYTHEEAYFDADKIEKIVTNLLSNAFKFTPQNGRVHVRVQTTLEELKIVVHDFGIGIAPERLPHIFDRFYQVDNSAGRHYEGTGIGLALVKELIEVLKGNVNVESVVGKGTIFAVNIPIGRMTWEDQIIEHDYLEMIPPLPALVQSSNESESTTEGQWPIVLLVEDNPDLRVYMRAIFENQYQIIEAIDGQQGLEKAIEYIPDLVICDLMMPRLDGLGLCRAIRSDIRTSHIPIIMLTAKSTMQDRLEGLELGADDYLTKPFNRDEMEVRVQNLIRQREILRQKYGQQIAETMAQVREKPVLSLNEQFLQKAVTVVEEHLSDSSFDVELFCKAMNMSRSNMHRKLRALTSQSATEFIRSIRLERAAELLKRRTGTVSDIAFQVGFESLPYFSKSFQEQFGIPPSEYR